jgi:chromosome segregation ATPase
MTDLSTTIGQLEQELVDYRVRLKDFAEVLDDLEQVQTEFDAMTHTHRMLKSEYEKLTEYIEEAQVLSANIENECKLAIEKVNLAEESINERLAGLENVSLANANQIESSFENKFIELQKNRDNITLELRAELEDKVKALEAKFQQQLANTVQQWDEKCNSLQLTFSELEAKYDETGRSLTSIKSKSETSKQSLGKIDNIEESLKKIEQRSGETEGLMYLVACVGCVLAVALGALPFWLQGRNQPANPQAATMENIRQ